MAETDPLGRNWKLWGGVLAFIAAVVIVGLIFFPRTPPQPEATPTAPAPSVPVETAPPSTSPSASASKPATGDCPALSTDNSFPNEAPASEWKRHPAGMLLPVNADHGPAKMDGDFWRCFSHTPSGAVMSGITLLFDFSSGGVLMRLLIHPKERPYLKNGRTLKLRQNFLSFPDSELWTALIKPRPSNILHQWPINTPTRV